MMKYLVTAVISLGFSYFVIYVCLGLEWTWVRAIASALLAVAVHYWLSQRKHARSGGDRS